MKNLPLIIACTLLFSQLGFAQYDPTKIHPKALEAYEKGLEKAQEGKYKDAIESLQKAIETDPKYIDAYISLGGVHGQMKNHEQSIAAYEKAFAIDSNYTSVMRLPYSINLAGAGQFEKALRTIDALLLRSDLAATTRKAAEYRRKTYQFGVDFAKAHATENYTYAPKNLGDGVNTSESEYFPSISIEGTELIFTRLLNKRNEDFFGSKRLEDKWSPAFQLGGEINTPENEGAQNLSQDGKWLVFTGCHRPGGYGSCDLYISYLTETGWSEALNLGGKINSDQWDSQPSLSPDKRDL